MKKVALVWELGSGLGHTSTFLPIVRSLKKAGYQPFLILKDISHMELIYGDDIVEYIQAPIWNKPCSTGRQQLSFTDSLFNFGYLDSYGLISMIKAWKNIFDLISPDLIFFDYAPTALLAAKMLKVPRIVFGNCFSVPPKVSPITAYRFWETSDLQEKAIEENERRCLNSINHVLDSFGLTSINAVHDIYDAEHCFITTDPLLDIYGVRSNVEYLGALSTNEIGSSLVNWPLDGAKKIFVYIKSSYEYIDSLLMMLKLSDAQYIIYCAGLSDTKIKKYQAKHIVFSDSPCNISKIRESSDAAIVHGGNLMEKFLEVGQPLLLLPIQMENLMMAKAAMKYGSVQYFTGDNLDFLKEAIFKLINNSIVKYNAITLSQRMLGFDQSLQMKKIISKVDSLLDSGERD